MPTIEEMQQELEAVGYLKDSLKGGSLLLNIWEMNNVCFLDMDYDKSVEKAYAHYLQQKEHAEMKALLEDILKTWENYDLPNNADIDLHNAALAAQFARTAIRAKAILAEKETSA